MTSLIGNAKGKPGAPEDLIVRSECQLELRLPDEYREFLLSSHGCEGFIGPNAYVISWSVEELSSLNQGYEVQKYLPGALLFGSDGGGEGYGFDLRTAKPLIVQVPFTGMSWNDANVISNSFFGFLRHLSDSHP